MPHVLSKVEVDSSKYNVEIDGDWDEWVSNEVSRLQRQALESERDDDYKGKDIALGHSTFGDSDGNRFIHGPRGIQAMNDGSNWSYMLQDGLGSVRGVIDSVLDVDASQSYDPMGNPAGSYGAGFGFTGEQTDGNGQVYLRARYYTPNMGVFTALDPEYAWAWNGLGLCHSACWRYPHTRGGEPFGLNVSKPEEDAVALAAAAAIADAYGPPDIAPTIPDEAI